MNIRARVHDVLDEALEVRGLGSMQLGFGSSYRGWKEAYYRLYERGLEMTAKAYLSQAMWLDSIIIQKLEEQERLQALAEKMTPSYAEVKVSNGQHINTREENNVKLIDLKHETNEIIDRLVDLTQEIRCKIRQVEDPLDQLVLEMRYLNKKSWNEVAESLGYDKRYTMKLHARALKKIDRILKEDTKRHRKTPGNYDRV